MPGEITVSTGTTTIRDKTTPNKLLPLKGERLKVAMLSVHSSPMGELGTRDTGGMSVYVRELARELGKRGHLVDIYTRLNDSRQDQLAELYENVRLVHLRAGTTVI